MFRKEPPSPQALSKRRRNKGNSRLDDNSDDDGLLNDNPFMLNLEETITKTHPNKPHKLRHSLTQDNVDDLLENPLNITESILSPTKKSKGEKVPYSLRHKGKVDGDKKEESDDDFLNNDAPKVKLGDTNGGEKQKNDKKTPVKEGNENKEKGRKRLRQITLEDDNSFEDTIDFEDRKSANSGKENNNNNSSNSGTNKQKKYRAFFGGFVRKEP
eukprot:TRINITY_DN15439_c0_g1_i1.p1 TRINITY_DN15439_c0_g1~~TRINITY_DN15439_c0_g1_i1.p1  ORF type:complete len:214 (-),score=66.44 TRINITY_DN15439_c0_g1_i1:263-904(-)